MAWEGPVQGYKAPVVAILAQATVPFESTLCHRALVYICHHVKPRGLQNLHTERVRGGSGGWDYTSARWEAHPRLHVMFIVAFNVVQLVALAMVA